MPEDPQELRKLIADLTERVYRLEQLAGVESAGSAPAIPERRESASSPASAKAPAGSKPAESLESRIGSQWFNRIGIIAVLVGVSYFLKYAFENNWIGPAGRIGISLLAGLAVILWSERFRTRGQMGFSWSLKALGIGTLYLSLWAAFQIYHLVASPTALTAMSLVTAGTAILAIRQNAQVLAAFALLGGFATPVLLSSGENHEVVLFSYVAVLVIATLVLVAFRPWVRLLLGSYVGTLILYLAWYGGFYSRTQLELTLFFASLFFAMFAVGPILALGSAAKSTRGFSWVLGSVTLLNAVCYFTQAYVMLAGVSRTALALLAAALAAVHLALSRQGMRRVQDQTDARLLKLLYVALAVAFLTAAVPLTLESYRITLAWFAEAAALTWIAYRAASDFLRVLASGVLALGIGHLWIVDHFRPAQLVFNARFATYLAAVAVLAFSVALALRALPENTPNRRIHRAAAGLGIVLINVLILLALNFEIRDYFLQAMEGVRQLHPGKGTALAEYRQVGIARDFMYSAMWMAYGGLLMWVGFWRRSAFLRWQALVLMTITVVKVFAYDVSQLERGYRIFSFFALGVLLLGVSFLYQRDWLRLSTQRKGNSTSV